MGKKRGKREGLYRKRVYKKQVRTMEETLDIHKQSKYFFIVTVIAFLLFSLFLVRSFIIPLLSGILLAYIFFPVYKFLRKTVFSQNLAAMLTILSVILIFIIPLFFTANALIGQSITLFQEIKSMDLSRFEEKIPEFLRGNVNFDDYIKDALNKLTLSLARGTSDFLISLPKKLLEFFVMFFVMFYMLKEGKSLIEKIRLHIPLKEKYRRHVSERFNSVIYATIYGIVITAIVQGTVGAIGLWIFGVPSPLLWGLVMTILAMIPFVGPAFVWLPAALFKLGTGDTFQGVGLILYGIFIVSTIDNVVRPKIIGSKGDIHPALVLLGVLGGLEVFGLLGIILGPLILAISAVFLSLYVDEHVEDYHH